LVNDSTAVNPLYRTIDLRDLGKALAATDNSDFTAIYQNLERGSRNHMRAFVGQLEAVGESYAAQFIGAPALAEILASPNEAGMGYGRGGNGRMGGGCCNGACLGTSPVTGPGPNPQRSR
jgi:hypothetical protein